MVVYLVCAAAARREPHPYSSQKGLPNADIHGLVIGGGADINPKWYGGSEVEELFSKDQKISGASSIYNTV
ncbi:MAG: hypothetical protein U5J63_09875 [Fodinibius sp.]|nr:hypothetical protein [Fodinibius sp.]